MQPTQHPPAILPLLLPPRQNHQIRNQRHALHHDGEGHQEADTAPHAAEIAVVVAVALVGEVVALMGEGGAAFVEAVGVVDAFTARLDGVQRD